MRATQRDQLRCRIAVRDNFADDDVFAGRFRLSAPCTATLAEFAMSANGRCGSVHHGISGYVKPLAPAIFPTCQRAASKGTMSATSGRSERRDRIGRERLARRSFHEMIPLNRAIGPQPIAHRLGEARQFQAGGAPAPKASRHLRGHCRRLDARDVMHEGLSRTRDQS